MYVHCLRIYRYNMYLYSECMLLRFLSSRRPWHRLGIVAEACRASTFFEFFAHLHGLFSDHLRRASASVVRKVQDTVWMIMDHGCIWCNVLICTVPFSWYPQSFYKTSWNIQTLSLGLSRRTAVLFTIQNQGPVSLSLCSLGGFIRMGPGGLIWYHQIMYRRPTGSGSASSDAPPECASCSSIGLLWAVPSRRTWTIRQASLLTLWSSNMAVGNPLEMEVSVGECRKIMENHGKNADALRI